LSKLIYIADDEYNIRNLVKTFLQNEGYEVKDFENGELLLKEFNKIECDLVILDIMMTGRNGFEICKEIRQKSIVPIVMLTAKDTDMDYITGIALGSDDYFTKPFSPMLLVMRIKAIFRRIEFEKNQKNELDEDKELIFSNMKINLKSKIVSFNEENIDVTPNEYNLLKYLFKYNDRAISREELLDKVWGYESEVETRAVDDTVKRLRKKLLNTDLSIETIWGFGFRLKETNNE